MIGTSLLAKATDDGNPCEIALGRRSAAKPAERGANGAPPPASAAAPATGDPIGRALGKLLGR